MSVLKRFQNLLQSGLVFGRERLICWGQHYTLEEHELTTANAQQRLSIIRAVMSSLNRLLAYQLQPLRAQIVKKVHRNLLFGFFRAPMPVSSLRLFALVQALVSFVNWSFGSYFTLIFPLING